MPPERKLLREELDPLRTEREKNEDFFDELELEDRLGRVNFASLLVLLALGDFTLLVRLDGSYCLAVLAPANPDTRFL